MYLFQVVRSNWSKDKGWGTSETSGVFPFKDGQPFTLEFAAAPNNTIIVIIYSTPFRNLFIFHRLISIINVLQLSLVGI